VLKIRLRRVGKAKQPLYRIVVADSRAPRDGAFVEILGQYNPRANPSTINLNEERARYWIGKGAQPSDRAAKLFQIQGIMELPPKLKAAIEATKARPKPAKEEPAEEAAPAAPAAAAPEAPAEAAVSEEAPTAEAAAEEAPAEAEAPAAEAPTTEEEPAEAPAAEADAPAEAESGS
jgi:small subunit ribosomal protein S16